MIRKIDKIFQLLIFSMKYAWRKYHFIIPPREFLGGIVKLRYRVDRALGKGYRAWIRENEKKVEYEKIEYNPLISIVIPHYNTPVKYLRECLDSALCQSYKNFEICIADDCSTNEESIKLLKEYEEKYSQIKVVWRKENGNISAATNSAIDIAKGEFIAFMDSDDVLSKDALYFNVKVLNENKELDLIYSDEDKLDEYGVRIEPHFKSDWNPELLLVANYICHFVVARATWVKELKCRSEFDGAQDHDFLLRLTEKTSNIYHIRKILYHWRMIPGSTAVSEKEKPYAIIARKKAMEEALERRNLKGKMTPCKKGFYFFNVLFDNNNEKVSILIPTHDNIKYLKPCIESIYEKTTYQNFEIIIIDHNSQEEKTLKYFEECKKKYNNLKIIRRECEFNHSYLTNEGAKLATGEYLVFLNSDIKVITPNWIEHMLGYARQENIGCVGAKLLYSNNTIQHAGIVLLRDKIAINYANGEVGNDYRTVVAGDYSAVTFACAMVSKEKFDMINGLNEELPADYNDVDFCLEMLKLGCRNVYVSAVILYHYESKNRGEIHASESNYSRWESSVKYIKNKWGNVLNYDKYINYL